MAQLRDTTISNNLFIGGGRIEDFIIETWEDSSLRKVGVYKYEKYKSGKVIAYFSRYFNFPEDKRYNVGSEYYWDVDIPVSSGIFNTVPEILVGTISGIGSIAYYNYDSTTTQLEIKVISPIMYVSEYNAVDIRGIIIGT